MLDMCAVTTAGKARGTRRTMFGRLTCASLAASLLVTLGCLSATAHASDVAKIKITFSPDRPGAQISIHTRVTLANTNGGLPSPVTGFDLHLPPQLELVGTTLGLAICQPSALLRDGLTGCSPNARIGSGSATVAVPFGPEVVSEKADIHLLMGPPLQEQVGVLIYAESLTPVSAQLVFPGILLIDSGPESLNTTFPPTPTLPGAPDASVTDMSLTVGPEHLTYYKRIHGRWTSYRPSGVSLPSKCPHGGFPFVTDMHFEDGTELRVPYTVPCPPLRHGGHGA
ncbi:MAG TPA: hypothetical protein VGY76_10990 [Solirubrobacteraceae bacterium]|jgi:hypothetical protein|nr:hypothetical protein [Solirubrobacteraceae bacterium]